MRTDRVNIKRFLYNFQEMENILLENAVEGIQMYGMYPVRSMTMIRIMKISYFRVTDY